MRFPFRVLIAIPIIAAVFSAHADSLLVLSVDVQPLAGASFAGQHQVTVRFRNDSRGSEAAPHVIAAVPHGFVVVEGSAQGPGALVAYSPDGSASFVDESQWRFSGSARVTHLRWDLPGPLETGVSGVVSFRVRPEPEATSISQ